MECLWGGEEGGFEFGDDLGGVRVLHRFDKSDMGTCLTNYSCRTTGLQLSISASQGQYGLKFFMGQ